MVEVPFYTATSSEPLRRDTCRVSSQQASGERHVSKKSFPALDSRNSAEEIPPSINRRVRYLCSAVRRVTDANKTNKQTTDLLMSLPGRYRPACLMHHTGTCSVSFPRAARRNVSFLSSGKSLGLNRKTTTTTTTNGFSSSLRS